MTTEATTNADEISVSDFGLLNEATPIIILGETTSAPDITSTYPLTIWRTVSGTK